MTGEEEQKYTLHNTPMVGILGSLPNYNSKLIKIVYFPLKMIFFQK